VREALLVTVYQLMRVIYLHAQQERQKMRYRSKKDTWLVALLCGITLLLFALGILYLLLPGIPRGAAWLVLFIGIAMGAFFLALMTTTYYEITPAALIVHSVGLHREIQLGAIQQVFPTRNPLSGPALSLDRLQVDYSRGGRARFTLISPEDKLSFMQDLAANSEDLEVRDGRVVHKKRDFRGQT
jgi:Bacterial PH domain